jgi:hypothetical protein
MIEKLLIAVFIVFLVCVVAFVFTGLASFILCVMVFGSLATVLNGGS